MVECVLITLASAFKVSFATLKLFSRALPRNLRNDLDRKILVPENSCFIVFACCVSMFLVHYCLSLAVVPTSRDHLHIVF